MTDTDDMPRCTATKPDGTRCRMLHGFYGVAFGSDGRCPKHTADPAIREQMRAKDSRGGRARHVPKAPETLDDALRMAGWCAQETAQGRMDEKRADGVMKLLKEFRELLRLRDEDTKLAAIRAATQTIKDAQR